jgi:SAM-dependent methyltransferase
VSEQVPPIEATGERLIPEAYAGELVLAEHIARYALAARIAPGRRVLDAASGEGYGTAMLAAAGPQSIVGVDADPASVAHAHQRYGLDFRVTDVCELPFADAEFDLVTSFETIEHVADPARALDEFARVLDARGLLLVSSPNANEYLEDNPFHVRELAPDEFIGALEARFEHVRRLYQQNFLTSAILDRDTLTLDDYNRPVDLEVRKVAGVGPGRELYCLALCGHGPLPPVDVELAALSDIYEAHHLAAEMRAWQRAQQAFEARATTAERIQSDWEARATEAERIQREWEARATEAERQTVELRATIDRIAASLSWRLTKPLRAVRGRSK